MDCNGNIITSNFYLGNCTHYRYQEEKLAFVRDLPFGLSDYVHGVRFFRPNVVAITLTRGSTGIFFLDPDTRSRLLHIPTALKTQDVCFLSNNRLVMLTANGTDEACSECLPVGAPFGRLFHRRAKLRDRIDRDIRKYALRLRCPSQGETLFDGSDERPRGNRGSDRLDAGWRTGWLLLSPRDRQP